MVKCSIENDDQQLLHRSDQWVAPNDDPEWIEKGSKEQLNQVDGGLSHICIEYASKVTEKVAQGYLRDHQFHGLQKNLPDPSRYFHDDSLLTYCQVDGSHRRAESETEEKTLTDPIKRNATNEEDVVQAGTEKVWKVEYMQNLGKHIEWI